MAKEKGNKKSNKKYKVNLEKKTEIIIKEPIEEQIKSTNVEIKKVENNAIIVQVGGHFKRVKFDLSFKDLEYLRDHKKSYIKKTLTIFYMGDINNAFKVKILPLKSLSDII